MSASSIPNFSFLIPNSAAAPGGVRAAFTLVETALAMLAIGLGLLAFLGLGRLGLQTNKETLNDQRCAVLANAILETLRERNAYFVDLARTNQEGKVWVDFWHDTVKPNPDSNHKINFPLVADIIFPPENQANLIFNTLRFPAYDPDRIYLAAWNPRYTLIFPDPQIYDSKGYSSIGAGPNLIEVTLDIYPDGDTDSSDVRIYTTTLTNTGGL